LGITKLARDQCAEGIEKPIAIMNDEEMPTNFKLAAIA
jgi:hypothetical protein